MEAAVGCNTSAGQYFFGETSTNAVDPISLSYPATGPRIPGPFNYTLLRQWAQAELLLLQWLLPFDQASPFQISLQQNNLSNIYFTYWGVSLKDDY